MALRRILFAIFSLLVLACKPSIKPIPDKIYYKEVEVTFSATSGFYNEKIKPTLDNRCTDNCHAKPEIVDLQKWPYKIKGSFTELRVIEQFGENYTYSDAKKIIVEEMIDYMKKKTMPPFADDTDSGVEPVPEDELKLFDEWIIKDVPGPRESSFDGEIVIRGTLNNKEICTFKSLISKGVATLFSYQKPCVLADIISFHVFDSGNKEVKVESFSAKEYWDLGKVSISLNTKY